MSHGSSGGGLFNAYAQLVGITEFTLSEGQNLNFAIPIEWILSRAAANDVSPREPSQTLPSSSLQWAENAFQSGNYQQAVRAFSSALQENPNDWLAWERLGISHLRLGNNKEAINAFQQATKIKPEFASAWKHLGAAVMLDSDSCNPLQGCVNAADFIRKSISLNPNDADAWYYLGTAQFGVGTWSSVPRIPKQTELSLKAYLSQAVESFQRSLELRPDDTATISTLGWVYCLQERRGDAEQIYQKLKFLDVESANDIWDGCISKMHRK